MYNLYEVLAEVKVPLPFFCEKIGKAEKEVAELVAFESSETQMDLYLMFVTTMNDEELMPRLFRFFEFMGRFLHGNNFTRSLK